MNDEGTKIATEVKCIVWEWWMLPFDILRTRVNSSRAPRIPPLFLNYPITLSPIILIRSLFSPVTMLDNCARCNNASVIYWIGAGKRCEIEISTTQTGRICWWRWTSKARLPGSRAGGFKETFNNVNSRNMKKKIKVSLERRGAKKAELLQVGNVFSMC